MNQPSTTLWSPMVSAPDEDFSSFLDFNDFQLNFPAFDSTTHDGGGMQQETHGTLDASMGNNVDAVAFEEGDMGQQIDPSLMPQTTMAGINEVHGSAESLMELNMRSHLFHRRPDGNEQGQVKDQYQRQGMVPPTPNSIEMKGSHMQYHPQLDPYAQAMYDSYTRKHQDMNFTPLVSPAVTPHETQFRLPEYTMPGEYFSPLTSPALEAQNQHHAVQRSVYGAIRGSDTSDTTSPIDMNLDLNLDHPTNIAVPLRKSRRKTTSNKSKAPARSVRQSPAMKPQARKKNSSNTVIPPKEVSEIIEDAQKSKQNGHNLHANGNLSLPLNVDSSGADSVSPEPLSEALMPPPATPRPISAGRSPYLKANHAGSQSTPLLALRNSPATPASLMRIRKPTHGRSNSNTTQSSSLKEQTSMAEAEMEKILEDLTLPEQVKSTKPALAPLDVAMSNDSDTTPTMPARSGTSSATPSSAPLTATSTVFPSPQLGAMASPGGSVSSKRMEPKAVARSNKKRNSSSQVSPALRPKISPSIKPLLPEGTPLSTSTTTLLLASKSNYQNILEGTNLPGVSYPPTLATNLTSKRTSHKIAEQGRRNRINLALGEIAALLPAGMGGGAGDDGEGPSGGGGGGAGGGGNSKARTVEAAIQYIKMLKGEVKELRGKLEEVDGKEGKESGDGIKDATPDEAPGQVPSQGLSEVVQQEISSVS